MSNDNSNICTCGCCEGAENLTPLNVENQPGLSALQYRVGTHNSFKTSMLRSVSAKKALNGLTTRSDDDMSIATLDAWATVLDVLSFYQERIINEGFLRTATERFSILELSRLISYRPNSGVAASTYLKFNVSESPGAPLSAVVPVGTKVQSVPEQNELPQVYETVETIQAKVEWNAIRLQTRRKIIPVFGDNTIYLQGINTGLQPGDALLMIGDERKNSAGNENWDFRRVQTITVNTADGYTKITWATGLGTIRNNKNILPAVKNFKVYALRQRANLFGYNAPDFRSLSGSVKSAFIPSGIHAEYFNSTNFTNRVLLRTDSIINFNWGASSPAPGVNAENFSVRWAGFILAPVTGNVTFYTNADDSAKLWLDGAVIITDPGPHGTTEKNFSIWLQAGQLYSFRLDYGEATGAAVISLSWSAATLPKAIIPANAFFQPGNYNNWPGYSITAIAGKPDSIYLDALYPKIVTDSWVVLSTADYEEVYRVTNAADDARSNFMVNAKSTALTLEGENLVAQFDTHVRDAVLYGQAEELAIATAPVNDAITIGQKEIKLEELFTGLYNNKPVIISGKRMRIQITEAALPLQFAVPGNNSATRNLAAGDSLIILKKPELQANGNRHWFVEDNAGIEGEVLVSDAKISVVVANKDDSMVSELHFIELVKQNTDPTILVLNETIANYFDPDTVVVYANVAASTHGETRQEVLGSGDGSQQFQKFILKQAPLTFVSAATASGTATTLQVRVNDILWQEVPTLFGAGPTDKIYTTNISDNAVVTVQFGDGITGARLPTGTENIKAIYRMGIGSPGLLHSGQLSMLVTPQLGIDGVKNPLDTEGAADPESRDEARNNAPLTVLTLDRIVSLSDYENFSRAFAGIGKVKAEMIWSGEKQIVFISIAGNDAVQISKKSDLYLNLRKSVAGASHSTSVVQIENYTPILFSVNASIATDTAYVFENVQAAVILSLLNSFSFTARDFGQDITPAEITAVIQNVPGVVFTRLQFLNGNNPFSQQHFRLHAGTAMLQSNGNITAAELLMINPNDITITQFTT